MITGLGEHGGRRLVCLGIHRKNLEKMLAGEPIYARPEIHALPEDIEIILFFCETDDDGVKQVRDGGYIGIVEDRRTHHRHTICPTCYGKAHLWQEGYRGPLNFPPAACCFCGETHRGGMVVTPEDGTPTCGAKP